MGATETFEEGEPGGVLRPFGEEADVDAIWAGVVAGRVLKERGDEGGGGERIDGLLAGAEVLGCI